MTWTLPLVALFSRARFLRWLWAPAVVSPGDAADIYAEVDVTEKTTFMARESWHPRWHAYLDHVEIPVRRVTPTSRPSTSRPAIT